MKTLIIDRFEGGFALCEDEDKVFGIEVSELPKEAKEGDVLDINDEGEITINEEKTKARRELLKKKTGQMFKNNKKNKR